MSLIRINENLVFDNINRVLISEKLPERKKPLGLAAAFCLECLADARGHIVSQERLIHEGWQKHGFEVSSGNVRQVISQLRKAFSSLRESPDLLITVPKMGYRLNIQAQELPVSAPAEERPAVTEGEALLPAQHTVTPLLPPPATSRRGVPYTRKQRVALYALIVGLLMASTFGALHTFLPFVLTPVPDVYYRQITSKTLPDKNILVDPRFATDRRFIDTSLSLLVSTPFWKEDATRYDWIYLNGSINRKTHSFFLCDRSMKDPSLNCINRMFIEE